MVEMKTLYGPIVACLATILFIASCATAIIVYDFNSGRRSNLGIVQSCTTTSGASICSNAKFGCRGQQSTREATAAFVILATLCVAFGAIFGIARAFVPSLNAGALKHVFMGLMAATILFGLLAWILGFALYAGTFCGLKISGNNSANVGPQAPLALVAWIITIIALVIDKVMGGANGVGAPSENVQH